jgi:hypothetical protein
LRLARDPRVPLFPKLLLAVGIIFIVSPINWIPNFIPVLGQMEDLASEERSARSAERARGRHPDQLIVAG